MCAAYCWFTHSVDVLEMQCGEPTVTVNLALMSNDGINPSLVWEHAIRKSCYKALNKPGSHPIRFIWDWHFVPGSNPGVSVLLKIMSVCVHGNVLQTGFLGLGLYHMPAPNGVFCGQSRYKEMEMSAQNTLKTSEKNVSALLKEIHKCRWNVCWMEASSAPCKLISYKEMPLWEGLTSMVFKAKLVVCLFCKESFRSMASFLFSCRGTGVGWFQCKECLS